jgi:hypothetical protein
MEQYVQLELWSLLPGSAGGRALKEKRGTKYFRQIGKRGGEATREKYGVEYLRHQVGEARRERLRRLRVEPRTIYYFGDQVRIVPYWPENAHPNRKHPLYVRILHNEETHVKENTTRYRVQNSRNDGIIFLHKNRNLHLS